MSEWAKRWGYEMAKTSRPGIFRLKSGGWYVRARVKDPRTEKLVEVQRAIHEPITIGEAQRVLDDAVRDERAKLAGAGILTPQRWSDFAVSVLETKLAKGEIESAMNREAWATCLKNRLIPHFGKLWAHEVRRAHVLDWTDRVLAPLLTRGAPVTRGKVTRHCVYSPHTLNAWLRIMQSICAVAELKFEVPNAFRGVELFPTTSRRYTKERPNALTPDQARDFLDVAARVSPRQYAMICLGFVTGLRPSSLRPIRRKGPEADLDLKAGVLLVRRSNSFRQEIMGNTKQKRDQRIELPSPIVKILEAHVAGLEGKAAASDLLFPNEHGRMHSRSWLRYGFQRILDEMGLPYKLTPSGMRRTFNDLARVVKVHDVVTRSISGHSSGSVSDGGTTAMQRHYSTAQGSEQREAIGKIAKVVDLASRRKKVGS